MVVPFSSSASGDTLESTVLTMRRIGPPVCCYSCAHPDCDRRRREARVVCVVCESRIQPGEQYRVLCRVQGEAVTQVHVTCERRKWDR